MKRVFAFIAFFITMMSAALQPMNSFAENNSDSTNIPAESRLAITYLCGSDSVILTATLSIKKGDNTLALENAPIEFTASNGTICKLLGKAKTDQEGIAVVKVVSAGLPGDKDGMVAYVAKFAGTGKYPGAEASLNAKPAKIRLFFSIEDSLRILKVTATQKNEKGEEVAIPKETVLIYVPRLFSLLKIGEIALDETGTGTLEFPKEIVGDTLGNLVVVAKIEEHDKFGFVQGKNVINWGVHKQYYKAEVPSRELWTPIAPLWMIITLLVMLAGVWAHYMYAVYELVMIKRLSKKDKPLF
ncbi:MAG: Ig-like domain-containing protein [Bacteroidetes bacterium]|nr:Ig-like domain-containing protein [Bacteroidota bacterium]